MVEKQLSETGASLSLNTKELEPKTYTENPHFYPKPPVEMAKERAEKIAKDPILREVMLKETQEVISNNLISEAERQIILQKPQHSIGALNKK